MKIYDFVNVQNNLIKIQEELDKMAADDFEEQMRIYFPDFKRHGWRGLDGHSSKANINIWYSTHIISLNLKQILNGSSDRFVPVDKIIEKLKNIDIEENPTSVAQKIKWWTKETILDKEGTLYIEVCDPLTKDQFEIVETAIQRMSKDLSISEYNINDYETSNIVNALTFIKNYKYDRHYWEEDEDEEE